MKNMAGEVEPGVMGAPALFIAVPPTESGMCPHKEAAVRGRHKSAAH